jgi:ATP-dependent DNA helicase RecQ
MSTPAIEAVARETFGFEALRPGQREAIESVLEGRDTLVVMSTGSGKSAIYEIAGLMRPGATVVVTPQHARVEREPEYVCLAPEHLADAEVLDRVRGAGPTLIVIEDAHCVCERDQSFRPDYLRLGAFIAEMGHPTVLALTPSDSPRIRDELIEKLHLHDPFVVVSGLDRPLSG